MVDVDTNQSMQPFSFPLKEETLAACGEYSGDHTEGLVEDVERVGG